MRSRAGSLVAATGLALALLGPPPAGAQADLPELGARVAEAWRAGDAAVLDALLPDEGIDLSLDGDAHEGVVRRQARAALDRFFDAWRGGEVVVRRAAELGGSPRRALVELAWNPRARGAPEQRAFVIFVSLAWAGDRWRIEEIRVFS